MKKTMLVVAAALVALALPAVPAHAGDSPHRMPANRDKIGALLVQRGVVSRNATPQQLEAAVDTY